MIVPVQEVEIGLFEESDCLHSCDFLELLLLDADKSIFVRACFNVIVSIVLKRFDQSIASFLDEDNIAESMLQPFFELQDLLVLIEEGLIEKLV